MPKPITVMHIITRLIVGGAQENTIYSAQLLDKNLFKTSIICGPQTGSEGSLIEEAKDNAIPLTILPNMLREISLFNDIRTLITLVRIIRQQKIDIVHTHSSKAGILGRLAARIAGVPLLIHTVHGWSFHNFMSPLTRRFYITLECYTASFTDTLIVVTQRDIQKGLDVGIGAPDKYRLIYSAIPLAKFNPNQFQGDSMRQELGIPAEAVVIGNVGRFSHQKNPLEWVKVAGEIGRHNPNIYFLLVGDGPLRIQVETQLEKEGISQHTILTGLRRDIPQLLSAMDIFLLTSLWEGLPRVIPQAMSMGLPIVANRADGTIEAIQDGVNGFLCSPGDINGIVQRCQELISNPILRQEFGRKGQTYTQKEFDLDKMIKQIESIYLEGFSAKLAEKIPAS